MWSSHKAKKTILLISGSGLSHILVTFCFISYPKYTLKFVMTPYKLVPSMLNFSKKISLALLVQ